MGPHSLSSLLNYHSHTCFLEELFFLLSLPHHHLFPPHHPKNTKKHLIVDALSIFVFVRGMHVYELITLIFFYRWWEELGLWQDLNLARNQPLKWYIVPMVSLANPTMSQQRIDLTKTVSLIYIIDDIFDIYGTLEELTLLTEAVNKWDISTIEQLPYYVKSSFKAVFDTTNEIAHRVYEKHGFNPIKSLRKSV
ncbi:putative S-linalool synthase [Helianthus anomalus]